MSSLEDGDVEMTLEDLTDMPLAIYFDDKQLLWQAPRNSPRFGKSDLDHAMRILSKSLDLDVVIDVSPHIRFRLAADGAHFLAISERDPGGYLIHRFDETVQVINFTDGSTKIFRGSGTAATPGAIRSASRITDFATRIIPVDHRARYAEEFAAELNEIAQKGRKSDQIRYARHQLGRAFSTRRAIKSGGWSIGVRITAGASGGASLAWLAGWSLTVDLAIVSLSAVGGLAFVVISAERTERLIRLIRSTRDRKHSDDCD